MLWLWLLLPIAAKLMIVAVAAVISAVFVRFGGREKVEAWQQKREAEAATRKARQLRWAFVVVLLSGLSCLAYFIPRADVLMPGESVALLLIGGTVWLSLLALTGSLAWRYQSNETGKGD